MIDFVVAFGLMAVMEGLLYAALPASMKKALRAVLDMPDLYLRMGGLVTMAIGVLIVWAARST